MSTINQVEFARHLGVAKSYVTALKKAGRLVMTDTGLVEVEASIALIAKTADPNRDDVAQRHAEQRETPTAPMSPTSMSETSSETNKIGNSYQAARAVKEKYAALSAKLEYEKNSGDLIPKADVDFVLSDYGATLRGMMENLADRLAPVVYPLTTLEETHAALEEAATAILAEISDAMHRRATGVGA